MINLASLSSDTTTLSITAIIDTALCVGAGGSSGALADKPIVRNASGQLLIPASQFKGRLRHECEKLARGLRWSVCHSPKAETMCPQRAGVSPVQDFHRSDYRLNDNRYHCLICQIFGNPSLASRIDVDDLICSEEAENLPEVLRPGVTINRRRQTAEDQKLYWLEISPPALSLEFQGEIHIHRDAPPQTHLLLLAALKHIHALGGSKSTGLGWLSWQLDPWELDEASWQTLLPGGEQ